MVSYCIRLCTLLKVSQVSSYDSMTAHTLPPHWWPQVDFSCFVWNLVFKVGRRPCAEWTGAAPGRGNVSETVASVGEQLKPGGLVFLQGLTHTTTCATHCVNSALLILLFLFHYHIVFYYSLTQFIKSGRKHGTIKGSATTKIWAGPVSRLLLPGNTHLLWC